MGRGPLREPRIHGGLRGRARLQHRQGRLRPLQPAGRPCRLPAGSAVGDSRRGHSWRYCPAAGGLRGSGGGRGRSRCPVRPRVSRWVRHRRRLRSPGMRGRSRRVSLRARNRRTARPGRLEGRRLAQAGDPPGWFERIDAPGATRCAPGPGGDRDQGPRRRRGLLQHAPGGPRTLHSLSRATSRASTTSTTRSIVRRERLRPRPAPRRGVRPQLRPRVPLHRPRATTPTPSPVPRPQPRHRRARARGTVAR